ncbi:MAG: acetyl-CoA carboxylase biotin carboxyl carrier protein [candidate division Zixibacteria bacterium]|nr:acetyl-CoA carboxylase biotin carboxyl carrier protein [candidate division Zixibacteria bacterium]
MNEQTIRKLIKLVEDSDIDSLEVRRFFRTIRITKSRASNNHHLGGEGPHTLINLPSDDANSGGRSSPVPAGSARSVPPANLIEIKSPMVGTFYRSPAPDSPPFVQVNQQINPGDIVCIIEAMKLMNEIEAEQGGRIVRILVENAQPVEFGQPLYLLDPTSV